MSHRCSDSFAAVSVPFATSQPSTWRKAPCMRLTSADDGARMQTPLLHMAGWSLACARDSVPDHFAADLMGLRKLHLHCIHEHAALRQQWSAAITSARMPHLRVLPHAPGWLIKTACRLPQVLAALSTGEDVEVGDRSSAHHPLPIAFCSSNPTDYELKCIQSLAQLRHLSMSQSSSWQLLIYLQTMRLRDLESLCLASLHFGSGNASASWHRLWNSLSSLRVLRLYLPESGMNELLRPLSAATAHVRIEIVMQLRVEEVIAPSDAATAHGEEEDVTTAQDPFDGDPSLLALSQLLDALPSLRISLLFCPFADGRGIVRSRDRRLKPHAPMVGRGILEPGDGTCSTPHWRGRGGGPPRHSPEKGSEGAEALGAHRGRVGTAV